MIKVPLHLELSPLRISLAAANCYYMKQLFFCILFLPLIAIGQKSANSLSVLLNNNWQLVTAINLEGINDTVFDKTKNIKRWDLNKVSVYKLDTKTLAFMNSNGLIDRGTADSITVDRFIAHVQYPGGYPCVYEYSNIKQTGNTLTYTFRKWNYYGSDPTKERLFHYGYKAICRISKAKPERPTWADTEKKLGTKIGFVFTTVDGKPIAKKEIKIVTDVKGLHMMGSVYTNEKGEATGYFGDSYFAFNGHISMRMEYNGLHSTAVVEKKHCPLVIKRALTTGDDDDGIKIGIAPQDNE